jgi:hypothetical protein
MKRAQPLPTVNERLMRLPMACFEIVSGLFRPVPLARYLLLHFAGNGIPVRA